MSDATAEPNANVVVDADPREAAALDRVAAAPEPAPSEASSDAPRYTMSWLDGDDDDDETPPAAEPAAGEARPAPADEPDEPVQARRGRGWLMAVAVLAVLVSGTYRALRPAPAPTSAALDAERNGPAVPPPTDPILPIDPAGSAAAIPGAAEPEAPAAVQPRSDSTGDEDVLLPVEPVLPAEPASPTGPDQRLPQPSAADDERLVQIVQQLETHQALIERLERSERILRDRLEGLEIHAQASGGTADADTDGTAPLSSQARPPQAPPPSRKRVPPSTTSRPVKTSLQPRPDRPPRSSGARLPFSVETVDTWNGEPTVVVRSGSRLIDLKPGESRDGWRIEAARGQSVTLIGPDGGERTVQAGSGGEP